MVRVLWQEEVSTPFGVEHQPTHRWFETETEARTWAHNALLPDTYMVKVGERATLDWRPMDRIAWVANYRQMTYIIERTAAVWCPVVGNYEFTYTVRISGQTLMVGDSPIIVQCNNLEEAMLEAEKEAFPE